MKKYMIALIAFMMIFSQTPHLAKAVDHTKYMTVAEFVRKIVVSLYGEPNDISNSQTWADKYVFQFKQIGAGEIGYFYSRDNQLSTLLTHSQAARIIYQVLNKKTGSYSDDAIKYLYTENISCGHFHDKADYFENFDPMGMMTEEEASTLIENAKTVISGNSLPSCGNTSELKNTIPGRISKIADELHLHAQVTENEYFHGAEIIGEGFRFYLEYSDRPDGELNDHFEIQFGDNMNTQGIMLIAKTLIELGVNLPEESLVDLLTDELKRKFSFKNIENKDGLIFYAGSYQLPEGTNVYMIDWGVNKEGNTSFADLDNHWARWDMQWAIQTGITSGYDDNSVRPDASVTEAEFLAMMFRSFPTKMGYTENNGDWSRVYYQLAQKYNYPVKGINFVEARTGNITRGQVAQLIVATQGKNYSVGESINFLYKNKFAEGSNPGDQKPTISDFKPDQTLTRAEAVKFIRNLYEHSRFDQPQPRPSDSSSFDYLLLPAKLMINGQISNSQDGQPQYTNNILYVPVEKVVSGMGDQFSWDLKPYQATVKQANGRTIQLSITKSNAIVDGKEIPVSSLKNITDTGSTLAHPKVYSNKLYVPYDTIKGVLGYQSGLNNDSDNTIVFIGKKPESDAIASLLSVSPIPTPATETPKYDLPYQPLPKGWIPPHIKSTATDDASKNWKVLSDELGMYNLGGGVSYNPIAPKVMGSAPPVLISSSHDGSYDVSIVFRYWEGSVNNPQNNEIPYIAREVCKYFLGDKEGVRLFKIVDGGYNGEDVSQYTSSITQFGDRQVKFQDLKDGLTIFISKPNETLK